MEKRYETERLFLRPTVVDDAELILQLVNSPKWLRFIGDRQVRTEVAAAEYIRSRMIPQMQSHGYGNYTVIRKKDEAKLGTCGLYDRPGIAGVDIGFALLPKYERQGYAYESASHLLDLSRIEFGIPYIQAITVAENHASRNLIRRLGLNFVKMIRLEDDPEELMLFSNEEQVDTRC
jgi:RimJ/RimL family protein N-acetyltransferase